MSNEQKENKKVYYYGITDDYETVIINGKSYNVGKEVCEVILFIFKERDTYLNQIKNASLKN